MNDPRKTDDHGGDARTLGHYDKANDQDICLACHREQSPRRFIPITADYLESLQGSVDGLKVEIGCGFCGASLADVAGYALEAAKADAVRPSSPPACNGRDFSKA